MPDQSAEATLRYIVDSGISAIELMNGPAESYAGAPSGRGSGAELKQWRISASMDKYKALRKMYNDAGVKIYAWKCLNPNMSDEEFEYVFNVAEALGCTHTTVELTDDMAQLKRIGEFAEKRKIYAAYHTHTQGSMTAFDKAFAASKANLANVDFGHYVAGGNAGGSTVQFLQKFHDRIASFHMKDRTTPEHGAKNLPWGTGDTPLKEILQMVKKNKWTMPATIELEYDVPAGSDAVKEVAKCLQYCKAALDS
jgi:sugar phosphate isomerase/epimerase